MRKRIVITGLGAITALGEGVTPLWNAVLEGRSGIGNLKFENGWKPLGASIPAFDPEKFITQKNQNKIILAVERSSLTNVRAAFELSQSKIKVLKVSGTLKGLGK